MSVSYNCFLIVNVFYHTSRKTSRRDFEAPRSFKVSVSVSEAATSRLGLEDMGLGSRLDLGSEGLVHIPGILVQNFGPSFRPNVEIIFFSSKYKISPFRSFLSKRICCVLMKMTYVSFKLCCRVLQH